MKRLIPFVFLFFSMFMIGCKDDSSSNNPTPNTVSGVLQSDSWRVTYYWDTDHEETSSFANYQFVFSSNGVVTATRSGTTINGSWATILDDSKTKLVLDFASPADFEEISDDWEVIEQTGSKIRLQDISGGNGGTDYLTFEKN